MNRFDRITVTSVLVNGQPCIRGMRPTVKRVVEALALIRTGVTAPCG